MMSVYFYFIFYIQIFFLVNFRYGAKVFYSKVGKSSYSAYLAVQMLFWNRWNQETASVAHRPVVFTWTFLGKNPLTRQTRRTFNRSRANLNGPIRNTFYCFLMKPIRDNLAPGIPRALDLSPRHAQKSSGSRLEWNIFQQEKRNAKPFHLNSFLLRKTRFVMYYINNMLFSRVKITCFRAKAYLVFHWCLYNKY